MNEKSKVISGPTSYICDIQMGTPGPISHILYAIGDQSKERKLRCIPAKQKKLKTIVT